MKIVVVMEQSGDNIHGDWVDDNLSQINKMVDTVNAGDIGGGGCPPGQHWCAETNECHDDAKPQMEPLTLMGADVISLNEQTGTQLDGIPITSYPCGMGITAGGGSSRRIKVQEPNGNIRNPQSGDVYCIGIGQGHNQWSYVSQVGCKWEIEPREYCEGCQPPIGLGTPGGNCGVQCSKPPRILNLINGCTDPACADSGQMSGLASCSQSPQSCDTSTSSIYGDHAVQHNGGKIQMQLGRLTGLIIMIVQTILGPLIIWKLKQTQ